MPERDKHPPRKRNTDIWNPEPTRAGSSFGAAVLGFRASVMPKWAIRLNALNTLSLFTQ